MLDTLIARYRVWQLKTATIALLHSLSNRQLADMGIERANIAVVAHQTARAQQQPRPVQAPQKSLPQSAAYCGTAI